ncbi:MAG TPA: hypothetical protein VFV24_02065, partial [Candidatus Eisenbacteria bacterium]|nr:hypothetical protein [Candidatus Eisenbacteria bacterium]
SWGTNSGTLLDSTSASVTWVAPDSPGTYPVTVSIRASDPGGTQFFKQTTFQIFVDNQYERWTRSQEVQFDPAPVSNGSGGMSGVIYAEYRSVVTGKADIYHVPMPGGGPEKKTTDGTIHYIQRNGAPRTTEGFRKVSGPSMRADGQQIAFAAQADGDSQWIWIIPAAGIPPDTLRTPYGPFSRPLVLGQPGTHRMEANPRYSHKGDWLLFNSDSALVAGGNPRPWYQLSSDLNEPPQRVIEDVGLVSRVFWMPNWGPDNNPADDLPDSIVTMSFRLFGTPTQESNGLYKFPTTPPQATASLWLDDLDASEPDWSPDGQHIVFADPNPGTGERDIWIIRAGTNDRNNAVRVTSGPADDGHPRFSPDGNTIIFVSNRADRYGLNGIFATERRGYNVWSVQRFDRP